MSRTFNATCLDLVERGLDPIPLPVRQKFPNDTGWQSKVYTPSDRWDRHGVGHRCHTIGVIDADITDVDLASEVLAYAMQELGVTGWRIGQPPKWAALVINHYGGKQVSPAYGGHRIELLGDGQQVVLYNVHPDTGEPYKWAGTEPLKLVKGLLPVVDEGAVHRLFSHFDQLCRARGLPREGHARHNRLSGSEYEQRRRDAWEQYGGGPDWVTEQLKELRLIRQDRGFGKYEIECPWGEEHTNGDRGGACYWGPVGSVIKPAFNCLHSTCKGLDRRYGDLKAWLESELVRWMEEKA